MIIESQAYISIVHVADELSEYIEHQFAADILWLTWLVWFY